MKKQNEVDAQEFIAAEEELHKAKENAGIKEKEGPIKRLVNSYYSIKEAHVPVRLSRKNYIRFCIFTGWMGGHQYYSKHYVKAVLYTLLFWSGLPIAMTLIDLLVVIPMQADEDGMIEI